MTYDDIAAHFLVPGSEPIAEPNVPGTAARRLRDAVEPIATIGWWSREAATGATSLGLDFFGGYVWGRAASLGADVAPSIVVAAFGAFEPALLTAVLSGAQALASHDAVLAARESGATSGLAAATAGVAAATIELLGTRLMAAHSTLDGMGRPLFSALRALPVPDDAHGVAWRAAELVREHRGDGHIAACVAAGLGLAEMNVLTELWLGYAPGEYSASRGMSPDRVAAGLDSLRDRGWVDAAGGLSADGQSARDGIEAATDRSQDALVAALGDDLEEVIDAAGVISAAILTAQAAPADPRKRAAG